MEVKVQDPEFVKAATAETAAETAGPALTDHPAGSSTAAAGATHLAGGQADAYESSPPTTENLPPAPSPREGEPDSGADHPRQWRRFKASILKLSLLGHALTSTVGSAERTARSVVDRVRGLFQEGRDRADFMTRRNARRLGEEPAKKTDLRGATPQAEAAAKRATASPTIDPDLFKGV